MERETRKRATPKEMGASVYYFLMASAHFRELWGLFKEVRSADASSAVGSFLRSLPSKAQEAQTEFWAAFEGGDDSFAKRYLVPLRHLTFHYMKWPSLLSLEEASMKRVRVDFGRLRLRDARFEFADDVIDKTIEKLWGGSGQVEVVAPQLARFVGRFIAFANEAFTTWLVRHSHVVALEQEPV